MKDYTNRWVNNYIKNVDLKTIKWIKFSSSEYDKFIQDNYLDKKVWEYVLNKESSGSTLFGMAYLNVNHDFNSRNSYLLGIVDNNIGKKTIVAATIYDENCFLYNGQVKPVTYIISMEVNSYFRKQGIYKNMCDELINFIDPCQPIVTTKESDMGLICNTFELLKSSLTKKGFSLPIVIDNRYFVNTELYDLICSKEKRLIHK